METPKKKRLRWNWVVSIILGIYGIFCEIYSAVVLFGGSFKMFGSSFDLERVIGTFGFLFSVMLLMIEAIIIFSVIAVFSLILWGIDILCSKIKQKFL